MIKMFNATNAKMQPNVQMQTNADNDDNSIIPWIIKLTQQFYSFQS